MRRDAADSILLRNIYVILCINQYIGLKSEYRRGRRKERREERERMQGRRGELPVGSSAKPYDDPAYIVTSPA